MLPQEHAAELERKGMSCYKVFFERFVSEQSKRLIAQKSA